MYLLSGIGDGDARVPRAGRLRRDEAVSPEDGVVEAIRHGGDNWIAAVQWHPEFHRPELGVVDDTPLLRDFLQAAHAARATTA